MTEPSPPELTQSTSIIAIDGPAASGKSTVGGLLAQRLNYLYFDTGVLYRAVTWVALQRRIPISDELSVMELAEEIEIRLTRPTVDDGRQYTVYVEDEDITWAIRRPEVDANVSVVAAYPGVRGALLEQQRRIARSGSTVMVGRDIGTVVLPDADLKIYLDASAQERARRRHRETLARGEESEYEEVVQYLERRDRIDSEREAAPLRPASDALIIDTTEMSIDDVLGRIEGIVKERSQTHGLLADSRWSWSEALPRSFAFHRCINAVLRVMIRIFLLYDMSGLERVPRDGPLLVSINHINFLDAVLAAVLLPRDLLIMTKAETMKRPIFGSLVKWYGAFPVRRGQVDRSALRNALHILEMGHAFLIAPEGTRSHHGRIQRARNGMAYISLKSGAPILPVAIWGVEKFWRNLWRLRRTHVEIEIGEPFVLRAGGDRSNRAELTEMTKEAMWRLVRLLPEKYRGVYGGLPETDERYAQPYEPEISPKGHPHDQRTRS